MKFSVCTISFRHQLISLENIANWAKSQSFDAIELWGVHAKNMVDFPEYDKAWLESKGLRVSMISDYLPLDGALDDSLKSTNTLCQITNKWGAKKLRTFSGGRGSADVTKQERKAWTERLRSLCSIASDHGLELVVETHPNTLADTLDSTVQLIEEVDHPALRINFDVIHVWEMGADPMMALDKLAPVVSHMHFKNVKHRSLLSVFSPNNVYAPAGSRLGMTPLFSGAYDFDAFLEFLMNQSVISLRDLDTSLEWFGPDVMATLSQDRSKIAFFQEKYAAQQDNGVASLVVF